MTMNLRIYHLERAALHSRYKSVFVTLGYQLIEEDPLNCILRAVREEPAGACSSLLDIRKKKSRMEFKCWSSADSDRMYSGPSGLIRMGKRNSSNIFCLPSSPP